MIRHRKSRIHPEVSLFPFLAVLICTLGVLIVMLVMAANEADQSARQEQEQVADAQTEELISLQQEIDLHEIRAERWQRSRDEKILRVNQSRANRSHLREEVRRVEQELELAQAELDSVMTAIANASDDEVSSRPEAAITQESDLEALREELRQSREALDTQRAKHAASGPSRFVIVPHRGGGGTFRRPIYIECTESAIILQPLGIVLAKDEFAPPLQAGNMLDASLLTIREYWQRHDVAGDQGSPYPLIIIRPGGAETFVLARRAMKSWDNEFGYELVDSEKQLEFGHEDPQLESEVRATIAEARQRQRVLQNQQLQMASYQSQFSGGDSRPGLSVSGRSGGFVTSDGRPSHQVAQAFDRRRGTGGQENLGTGSDSTKGTPGSTPTGGSQSRQPGSASNRGAKASPSTGTESSNNAATVPRNGGPSAGGQSAFGQPADESSLARTRGKNWALPTQTPGATGYLRPIRVICGPQELTLVSGNGRDRTIPFEGDTASAVDPLVDEIWKQIDHWGIAGSGSFWKPQLRISVSPGGQSRYEELEGLLNQSGLVLEASQE